MSADPPITDAANADSWRGRSESPDQTAALAARIAAALRPGDVLALHGPLGAGKTQFVKGLARGLGVPDDEPVVSPTFVLVREYAGRLPLYHIDAYRLGGADDLDALGWDDMLTSGGIIVIEWAERIADRLPPHTIHVELDYADEPNKPSRTIRIRIPPGERRSIADFRLNPL